jgi:hypothetical protein
MTDHDQERCLCPDCRGIRATRWSAERRAARRSEAAERVAQIDKMARSLNAYQHPHAPDIVCVSSKALLELLEASS